jgi:hypothetical protein
MIGGRQRFTPVQRLLHWLMAVCILAMLFIGVGMVSTIMPKYLTLVSIHKPLGIAILLLALIRLAVRLRYGTPPLPADLPEPMKLAAHLSHYALYGLMIAMPLLGWGMLCRADPVGCCGRVIPRACPPRWRIRGDGVGLDPRRGHARRVTGPRWKAQARLSHPPAPIRIASIDGRRGGMKSGSRRQG